MAAGYMGFCQYSNESAASRIWRRKAPTSVPKTFCAAAKPRSCLRRRCTFPSLFLGGEVCQGALHKFRWAKRFLDEIDGA